jgi:hypothetical protein
VWIQTDSDGLPVLWQPSDSPYALSDSFSPSRQDTSHQPLPLAVRSPPLRELQLCRMTSAPTTQLRNPDDSCSTAYYRWSTVAPSHLERIAALSRSLGEGKARAYPELVLPLDFVTRSIPGRSSQQTEYVLVTFDRARKIDIEAVAVLIDDDDDIHPRRRRRLKLLEWRKCEGQPVVALPLAFTFDLLGSSPSSSLSLSTTAAKGIRIELPLQGADDTTRLVIPPEARTLIEVEVSPAEEAADSDYSNDEDGDRAVGHRPELLVPLLGTNDRFREWKVSKRTRWVMAPELEALQCAGELRLRRRCEAPEQQVVDDDEAEHLFETWVRLAGELRGHHRLARRTAGGREDEDEDGSASHEGSSTGFSTSLSASSFDPRTPRDGSEWLGPSADWDKRSAAAVVNSPPRQKAHDAHHRQPLPITNLSPPLPELHLERRPSTRMEDPEDDVRQQSTGYLSTAVTPPSHLKHATAFSRSLRSGDSAGSRAPPELVLPLELVTRPIPGRSSPKHTEYVLDTFDHARDIAVEAVAVLVDDHDDHPHPRRRLKLLEWRKGDGKASRPLVALPIAYPVGSPFRSPPVFPSSPPAASAASGARIELPVRGADGTLDDNAPRLVVPPEAQELVEVEIDLTEEAAAYSYEGNDDDEDDELQLPQLGTSDRFREWKVAKRTRWAMTPELEALEFAGELRLRRRRQRQRPEEFSRPSSPLVAQQRQEDQEQLMETWVRLAGELMGGHRSFNRTATGNNHRHEDGEVDGRSPSEEGGSIISASTSSTGTLPSASSFGLQTPVDDAEWLEASAGGWVKRSAATAVVAAAAGGGRATAGLGVHVEEGGHWGLVS